MKIALLGGTRGVGKQVLEQALARGHEVRALVRNPAALSSKHDRLTVVQGDALNAADVAKIVAGADAVVSSLGASSIWSTARTVSRGAAATAEAMKQHGVRRIVLVSVRGAGEMSLLLTVLTLLPRLLAFGIWDNVIADKNRAEKILSEAGLDYTFVRAPGLTDGPKVGYQLGAGAGYGSISRADTAAFILDELEQPRHVKAAPIVLTA